MYRIGGHLLHGYRRSGAAQLRQGGNYSANFQSAAEKNASFQKQILLDIYSFCLRASIEQAAF